MIEYAGDTMLTTRGERELREIKKIFVEEVHTVELQLFPKKCKMMMMMGE